MMQRTVLASSLAVALLALAGAPAHANLLTNGSFEADTIAGGFAPSFEYETAITGWTVSHPGSNGIVLFDKVAYGAFSGAGAGYTGSDGAQAIQLELTGHTISQTLNALTIGQQYQLTFDYGSYVSPAPSSFTFTVNGATSGVVNGTFPGWQSYSHVFAAAGTSTVLTFTSAGAYPHLDNISVTAVPEPSAYALALAGLGVLGFISRRRKSA